MKVLTKKLLTAFRVKMNTYYWELEKERKLTNSLEEHLSYTGEVAHSFFTKGRGRLKRKGTEQVSRSPT